MKLILPLLFIITSNLLHAGVDIQNYKKNYSWNNSWNNSIYSELDLLEDLIIMNGKIDNEDLKELGCSGYNNITDKGFCSTKSMYYYGL